MVIRKGGINKYRRGRLVLGVNRDKKNLKWG